MCCICVACNAFEVGRGFFLIFRFPVREDTAVNPAKNAAAGSPSAGLFYISLRNLHSQHDRSAVCSQIMKAALDSELPFELHKSVGHTAGSNADNIGIRFTGRNQIHHSSIIVDRAVTGGSLRMVLVDPFPIRTLYQIGVDIDAAVSSVNIAVPDGAYFSAAESAVTAGAEQDRKPEIGRSCGEKILHIEVSGRVQERAGAGWKRNAKGTVRHLLGERGMNQRIRIADRFGTDPRGKIRNPLLKFQTGKSLKLRRSENRSPNVPADGAGIFAYGVGSQYPFLAGNVIKYGVRQGNVEYGSRPCL